MCRNTTRQENLLHGKFPLYKYRYLLTEEEARERCQVLDSEVISSGDSDRMGYAYHYYTDGSLRIDGRIGCDVVHYANNIMREKHAVRILDDSATKQAELPRKNVALALDKKKTGSVVIVTDSLGAMLFLSVIDSPRVLAYLSSLACL